MDTNFMDIDVCESCGLRRPPLKALQMKPDIDEIDDWWQVCDACYQELINMEKDDSMSVAKKPGEQQKNTTVPSKNGSYSAGGYQGSVWSNTPQCSSPHENLIYWDDKTAGLLLCSHRGGVVTRPEVAYGLFFYKGWEDIRQPVVRTFASSMGTPMRKLPDSPGSYPPFAVIDWKDYQAPPAFVDEYAKMVAEDIKKGQMVQVGCMGGHGRTGTFAAMVWLCMAKKPKTGKEALERIREIYCDDAIEGKAQEDYLDAFADRLFNRNEGKANKPRRA